MNTRKVISIVIAIAIVALLYISANDYTEASLRIMSSVFTGFTIFFLYQAIYLLISKK